jgi:hypothetical protein
MLYDTLYYIQALSASTKTNEVTVMSTLSVRRLRIIIGDGCRRGSFHIRSHVKFGILVGSFGCARPAN